MEGQEQKEISGHLFSGENIVNFRGKEDFVGMLLNSLSKRKEADFAKSSSPGP